MPRSSFVNSFGFLCNGLIGLAATDELADADWRGCSPGGWNWMKLLAASHSRVISGILSKFNMLAI